MKKVFLTLVATMLTLFASAQVKYEVVCKELPGDLDTLYLFNLETRAPVNFVSVKGGEATVKGTVSDAATGEAIIGAAVRVKEHTAIGSVTDQKGHYLLQLYLM